MNLAEFILPSLPCCKKPHSEAKKKNYAKVDSEVDGVELEAQKPEEVG